MMDFLYSIFMAPVPAWVVWLYMLGTVFVFRWAHIWYQSMAKVAEEVLLQKARDDAFGSDR